MKAEVHGHRSRGCQQKRWIDVVNEDLKELGLTDDDAEDRDKWRKRTHVADPSPEGVIPA
jgi:hypothetical protein